MNSIANQKLNLPEHAPVMVLPCTQLFPRTLLPLHIFEPRYREMLAWSLEQDRVFCIAPTKPGLAEAHSIDDFHHIVGLGLVRACVGRKDGTSDLVLHGIARVRLTNFLQEKPFCIAEMQELIDEPATEEDNEDLIAELIEACTLLRAHGFAVTKEIDRQLSLIDDPALLSNIVAQSFLCDPEARQAVFSERRVANRARLLIRHLLEQMPGESSGE